MPHNAFSIIKAIRTKTDVPEWDEISKEYAPYIINKGLSFDMQAILLVNEVNKTHIKPEWAFAFLVAAVGKSKRYTEWIKAPKPHEATLLTLLTDMYKCSMAKAIDIANILTDDQKEVILSSKGGRN